MIRRAAVTLVLAMLGAFAAAPAAGASAPCEAELKVKCFAIESLDASLSTRQAGGHPDLSFRFKIAEDPESETDTLGTHDAYAPARNVRVELPPGLIGDPNALGASQQCEVIELTAGECPNGSQIGLVRIVLHKLHTEATEPLYMMTPPGGEVLARVGFVPLLTGGGVYADISVRSESDYGLTSEIIGSPFEYPLIEAETTMWGVPADHSHDNERCTPLQVYEGCTESVARPPSGKPLPFLTNPTSCGVPLAIRVGASSWVEPERYDTKSVSFPEITGCDQLSFGPTLEAEATSRRADSPTGLSMTIKLPAAKGVGILEPSQIKDMRIAMPPGLAINPAAADGQGVCSGEQVRLGERVNAECPEDAKMASTEFLVDGLSRRMKGAIYLREPQPGNPFRVWIVADDLGAHIKIEGQLHVDKSTGQIESIVLESPQAPLREVKLFFKSGFRAPLVTPDKCGTYYTHYEFTPWSGGPPKVGDAPMQITEGCDTGGFNPRLSAGSADATGGAFSPFLFTLTREDGEQNPQGLEVTLPRGITASFAGVAHCEGLAAQTGQCPADSRIGKVAAAIGAGPAPLWVPQAGKRPTAVYLGGPYKGAPTSIVAVVPKQAGPFDFGDEAVRSAVYVDPTTAQATAVADPLPQLIEGIPVSYRTLHVILDRQGFTLNPTSCAPKATEATLTSAQGAVSHPTFPYTATNCARLGFKPSLSLKLKGGTKRGRFPALSASFRPRAGDANASGIVARLPHSAFLEQGHFRTICTRVQYAANGGGGAGCPAGSVYGHVVAKTPILEAPLEGPVYLRSSNHNLPDMVLSLHGPPSLPIQIEAVGRIDSKNGGIRSSFEGIPDAPISEVALEMEGGAKGLIVNSTDLCASTNRATARLSAQNGRAITLHPALRAACKKPRNHNHNQTKRPGRPAHRRHRG